MAFPKIFKKPAPVKKPEKQSIQAEKQVGKASQEKEIKKTMGKMPVGVLVKPHVTEKATMLAEQNQYVFEVTPYASKKVVQQAVQVRYGVKVTRVNIVMGRSKKVRLGKTFGTKKGNKKAIVTVAPGQTLEIMPR
jgi:large subunit ribosomal protein L23